MLSSKCAHIGLLFCGVTISVLQLNGLTAYDVFLHNIKGCHRFSRSGKW